MNINEIAIGNELPSKEFSCDNRQLFLYNAVLFNAHKIHYDYPYATEAEGYRDLVLAGPLIGDWLHQCVDDWLSNGSEQWGELIGMEYSNRHAAYVDEVLNGSGPVVDVDQDEGLIQIELHIKNAQGDVIAPGKATVRIGQRNER